MHLLLMFLHTIENRNFMTLFIYWSLALKFVIYWRNTWNDIYTIQDLKKIADRHMKIEALIAPVCERLVVIFGINSWESRLYHYTGRGVIFYESRKRSALLKSPWGSTSSFTKVIIISRMILVLGKTILSWGFPSIVFQCCNLSSWNLLQEESDRPREPLAVWGGEIGEVHSCFGAGKRIYP